MKYESYNDDKKFFAQDCEEQMRLMVAVGDVLADDITEETISVIKEFDCVNKFLELPLNSPEEVNLKKIFATAVVIANEKGILPFRLPENAEEIASLVDEGLTRVKLAFKQQTGEMDAYEVADALIDKVALRAIVILDSVIDESLPIIAESLSKLALKHPYTASLAPFIEIVVPYVAEPVKNAICKGIRFIANESKPIVHKAIDYVKGKAKSFAVNLTKKLNPVLLS